MVTRAPGPRGTQAGSYAELDDRMLVLDFQAGQIEAFVEIHERYGALARHVCGRFLDNQQDVDEALQETWIRVFQGLHRFNGQFALRSWLARIATNVSLDILRARSRRPKVDDQPIDEHERVDGADGPEEEVEKLIQRDLIISVLTELPDSHRRALVLRELEGRSHKEIAAELEITPAQAKALIHRAKGTFRREWLRAATERHGLAGFFLIPVIWLSKLGGLAKRAADRTAEAVQAGGTEVATHATQAAQAVSAAAAPAAQAVSAAAPAASGVSERIIAAGLTIVVAGGVTVGAATIARDRSGSDRPVAVAAAPVAVPSDGPADGDPSPGQPAQTADEQAERQAKGDRQEDATEDRGEADVVAPGLVDPPAEPVVEPNAGPSDEPAPPAEPTPGEPTPSGGPTAEPTPSGEPAPPPEAPAWTFAFVAATSSDETCSCDVEPSLESSRLEGTVGGDISFAQKIKGVVLDLRRRPTWRFWLDMSGTAGPSGGVLTSKFVLSSEGNGPFWYESHAVLQNTIENDDGSYVYRFIGAYQIRPGDEPGEGMPQAGRMIVNVAVWPDGTIYLGSVALVGTS